MTARRRGPAGLDIAHAVQVYLFSRDEESAAKKTREQAAGPIRDWIRAHGTVDRDDSGSEVSGNIIWLLPEPVRIGSKVYTGMELRKKRSISFDEEAAIRLAEDLGIPLEQIGHYQFTVDQEAVYVLNQKGRITDSEIDALLVESEPTYSLWPVEGRQ